MLADEAEAHTDLELTELFSQLVRRGDEAVEQTRDQLEVLRKAGVVDAGAAGLVEIVRGIAAHLAGEPLPEVVEPERLGRRPIHQEASRFRYCAVFVVRATRSTHRRSSGSWRRSATRCSSSAMRAR